MISESISIENCGLRKGRLESSEDMLSFNRIKYFNYIYFSGKMNINHIRQKDISFALFKVLGKAFIFTLQLIKSALQNRKYFSSRGRIVFFVMSDNDYLSVYPVYLQLPQGTANLFGDKMHNRNITLFIPTILSAMLAAVFFPKLIYDYIKSDVNDRIRFKKGINDIVLSYPFYYVCFLWFKIVKPAGIVISNDHVYSTRILVYWANKFEIPSFYIQHASVTKEFPPLEVTYAFLEGEDAKEKYILAGSDPAKIELIGIPKLDGAFRNINYRKRIRTIGIVSNSVESLQFIFDLITFFDKHYIDVKIIYRPHRSQYFDPTQKADLKNMIKKLPSNIIISNPFEEVVTEYLSKIDCLIAGDSAIHLEAALCNVTSIHFFHTAEYVDYYGFVKNKLIDQAKDFDELKNMIDKIKNDRQRVRYRAKKYCYTVGTEYDGRSTELAVKLLKEKISNQ